ncbi:MAG: flagellar hook-basal body complex protein [Campylobacterales bacterium]|nr:flagellar hook-basal body complex protein [Campylobacterales bacterium]
MNQSFYTAISGSKSYQNAIDLTANNIAHVNTIGYKGSSTDFSTLFASQLGLNNTTHASDKSYGSTTSTALDLTEGSYQETPNTFDMALNGDGWFGIATSNVLNGRDIGFTRNGVFSRDRDSYLVNTSGNYLLGTNYQNIIKTENGYEIDPSVSSQDPNLVSQSKLFVPKEITFPPTASTQVEILSNLNDDKVFYTPARESSGFNSLFNDDNEFIDLRDGQNITLKTNGKEYSLVYKENPSGGNEFSTVKELTTLINQQINTNYPDKGADVTIDGNGKISIYAKESINIDFVAGDNTNSKFLAMLSSLTGTLEENSSTKSFPLQRMEKSIPGVVVDPNGDIKNVKISMVLVDNKNTHGGNSWQITSDISSNVGIEPSLDMANVLNGTDDTRLVPNQDLWVKAGLAETMYMSRKEGYVFKLSPDSQAGQSDSLSFNLDGQDYTVNITDGSSKRDVASQLTAVLQGAGYEVANDGSDNIVVFPKGDSLVVKNGTSTIPAITIPDLALTHMTYGENFTTAEDFLSKINSNVEKINLKMEIKDGKLTMANNNSSSSFFSFKPGENTNVKFVTAISSLGGLISGNSSIESNQISGKKIYDQTSALYEFKESGKQVDPKNVTLNNMGETLTINLDSIISTVAQTPIVDGFSHNGILRGNFQEYAIGEDGSINISFSNGKTTSVGKVPVYHFQNDQGLEKIGDNLFVESQNSGKPFFYLDKNGNYFEETRVFGKTLENSNVQTAVALTELIVFQRSFGGTAKAITTSDQMIQNAINLKK